jgi:hypothetical protein
MLQVGFDPMISVFERAKTVPVLDYAVTVIDRQYNYSYKNTFAK